MKISTREVEMVTYRSEVLEKFKAQFGMCSRATYEMLEEIDNDIKSDINDYQFIVRTNSNGTMDIIAIGDAPIDSAIQEIENIISNLTEGYYE